MLSIDEVHRKKYKTLLGLDEILSNQLHFKCNMFLSVIRNRYDYSVLFAKLRFYHCVDISDHCGAQCVPEYLL